MSKSQVLKTEPRERKGSRHARALRQGGRIPAVLLSDGTAASIQFSIGIHDFMSARRRHVHLFELDVAGAVETALVRELQWDTFGEDVLHVEFKRVRRDVETEAEVELEFTGHPKTGMLNHLLTHVTVRCVPALIPDSIEVPVGHLEQGGVIQARDLKVPEGVQLALPPETPIANSVLVKIEVEAPAAVPTPEGAVAAPGAGPGAATPAAASEAAGKAAPKAPGKEKEGRGKES